MTMQSKRSNNGWAEKQIFTTGEAAEVCKVSQQTIIRCFDSGRLQGFRVPGSRFRRIPRHELLRFMKSNEIPTDLLEGGRRRILVVDDDPQIVELIADVLDRHGEFEVRTARNGYDAGLLTQRFKPNLILLDYMLPDINGNIVCERIRQTEGFEHTRIMIISGVINEEEINAMLDIGADAFIKKPFDVDEFLAKLEELLAVHH